MEREPVLKISNITKTFGSTKALTDVSIDFYPGEIRGLIGENGSGKSTVANIVMGVHKPDAGTMTFRGQEHRPVSMKDAIKNHVCMVVQEMATINDLSIADNVFLGLEKDFSKNGIINRKKMHVTARKLLEQVSLPDLNPAANINTLSFEDRKLVEVARALYSEPEILFVDETTTALSQRGREIMYTVMHRLADKGKTIICISHDIEELMQHANAVSVMRDGHFVKTVGREELDENYLKSLMIGREMAEHYYREDYNGALTDDVVLKCEDLCFEDKVRHVNLELHKGEILGIGGLTDCGMHEVARLMFGIDKPDKGTVTLTSGNVIINNPNTAVKHKIAYMSKNRDQEALMLNSSIEMNIAISAADKLKRGIFILPGDENKLADTEASKMEVKMSGVKARVNSLSGGNKQKVVIAKWMANDSEILLMDCPTRGIDIGVKESIYRLMERLKSEGKAILMISEEMPELIGMSDRIIVMKDGKIQKEFLRSGELGEQDVIQYMI